MKGKILIATKNSGKLHEFKRFFGKRLTGLEIISFNDLDYIIPDCEETGKTFEENARLKIENTRAYLMGDDKDLIIISDDSGMSIDALDGKPGVYTRRWIGREMSDDEIIDHCLSLMKNETNRKAAYISCFAVSIPGEPIAIVQGRSEGEILPELHEASLLPGLPFRALFYVPELNRMFHAVRDLDPKSREGYDLGHEQAMHECTRIVDNFLMAA